MYDSWFGGLEIWLILGWLATVGIRCQVYKQPLYGGCGLPRRERGAMASPAATPTQPPTRLAA